MAPAARSVYDVRVLDPAPGEASRSWLLGAIVAAFGDVTSRSRVRVEIIATDTGELLADWTISPVEGLFLKAKIESDLNEMNADAFASEWGLSTPPSERDLESN